MRRRLRQGAHRAAAGRTCPSIPDGWNTTTGSIVAASTQGLRSRELH